MPLLNSLTQFLVRSIGPKSAEPKAKSLRDDSFTTGGCHCRAQVCGQSA